MKKNRLFFLAPTEYTLVYKTHSALEFPKGIPLHLHYTLGFVRVVAQTVKTPVPYSSSLLYDALRYFPSSLQSSSWEVAPAPVFNIGFNYLEEGL